ncbi:ECF transporter S component [Periweissella beninensis]|uniref:ECF transporter S component n=1 Tax=Periweissella beninensis TaxID=504936 RepID=A0ABT0VIT9_9LACO|nr:ECF transporter S component [Periweissella beninensis]MBM7544372.1 putative membrane protein [Periweissella beninensis]MCM2437747.1 ECF transporter S component [Periweissella beninensis]MCT4395955.1 ECF transporter S component [Periweissella beninensis]
MTSKNTKIQKLVIAAVFMAIILIQVIFNLGYIPLGAFFVGAAVTIIQFTVAIGTILLGVRFGIVLGAFWGVLRLWQAWTTPGSLGSLMFMNPITSVGASVLIAISVGLFIKVVKFDINQPQSWVLAIAGIIAAITNTAVVTLSTWIGFSIMHLNWQKIVNLGHNQDFLPWFLTTIVGFNGIFEVIAGFILVPLVTIPLLKIRH